MVANAENPAAPDLILFDGVCGLCNASVRFVLDRDPGQRFRFAALQSELARQILARNGLAAEALGSVRLVLHRDTSTEHVLSRSDAALEILRTLQTPWRWLRFLRFLPRPLRDVGYALVAKTRYRLFGRYATCPLPSPEHRQRFL